MSEEQKPNIIILFPDQWRGDCLGHRGHPDIRTPWADQLAAEGMSYPRAFSPAPTCIPARMALMTGMSPWANGRTGYQEGVTWRPPHTLPGLLRDAGYQTMQVGKTHFAPMRAHLGFEINDMYEASVREPGFQSDYHAELARALPGVEDEALKRHPNAQVVNPWNAQREWHCSEWITTRAIERIERRDPLRPFLLQIGWHRPHPPFDPPRDLWEDWRDRPVAAPPVGDWCVDKGAKTQAHLTSSWGQRWDDARSLESRRAYYASIQHVDEQIGRVLWALKRQGIDQDTWIVLCSDHGEMLGDHHRWEKRQPNIACAAIPMVVRPARSSTLARYGVDDRPCLLTDLMPSCLEWAGVPVPERCDARSFNAEALERIHAEHHGWNSDWHALYDRRWAYHWYNDGTERLFDHTADPQELHDCAADHPDVLADFRSDLVARLHARGCGTSDGQQLISGHSIGPTQERSWC